MCPEWDREAPKKEYTRPERRLMSMLAEMGLQVQGQVPVGRYRLDVFVKEVWLGFEADGAKAHAGLVRKTKDAERDQWIYDNAGIPVLRIPEVKLRRHCWEETKADLMAFIEDWGPSAERRKERGDWILSQ